MHDLGLVIGRYRDIYRNLNCDIYCVIYCAIYLYSDERHENFCQNFTPLD